MLGSSCCKQWVANLCKRLNSGVRQTFALWRSEKSLRSSKNLLNIYLVHKMLKKGIYCTAKIDGEIWSLSITAQSRKTPILFFSKPLKLAQRQHVRRTAGKERNEAHAEFKRYHWPDLNSSLSTEVVSIVDFHLFSFILSLLSRSIIEP